MATAIGDAGLGPGDAVGMHMAHTPEAIVAYLAVSAPALTLVPIPSIHSDRETRFILADSRARMLITAASWRGYEYLRPSRVTRRTACSSTWWSRAVTRRTTPRSATCWPRRPGAAGLSPLAGERPAATLHLGQHREPQGRDALRRHAVLRGRAELPADPDGGLDLAQRDARRAHGGYLAALKSMLFGPPCVWMERWNPDLALDLIREYRVSHATLVPFHLMTVLEP